MKNFSDVLSYLRKKNKQSQEEIAAALGVAKSTISMYERGQRKPSFEILEAIADYYNVDMDFLTGKSNVERRVTVLPTGPIANQDDDGISGKYYRLNDHGQLVLMEMADFLLTKYAAFPDLEDGLQLKVVEQPKKMPDNVIDMGTIQRFLHFPAAGYSSPVFDEDYIEMPRTPDMPKDADYCLNIRGDSMEPYIHDGQLVYVKRVASLEEGEVGIWSWQGETYCKQAVEGPFGEIYLLSANPAREDANKRIPADQVGDLKLLGKVILAKRLPMPHYH